MRRRANRARALRNAEKEEEKEEEKKRRVTAREMRAFTSFTALDWVVFLCGLFSGRAVDGQRIPDSCWDLLDSANGRALSRSRTRGFGRIFLRDLGLLTRETKRMCRTVGWVRNRNVTEWGYIWHALSSKVGRLGLQTPSFNDMGVHVLTISYTHTNAPLSFFRGYTQQPDPCIQLTMLMARSRKRSSLLSFFCLAGITRQGERISRPRPFTEAS